MFAIATKKAFTACAARLAKAITINDAFSIVQHYLKKEQSKVNDQHDYSAKFILDKIETYTLNRNLNIPIDKTRAANWLSKSLSGDDYNVTSAKLKAYNPIDLTSEMGIINARDTITLFEEFLYSQQHYQPTFNSFVASLATGFDIAFDEGTDTPFDFNEDNNSGEAFLAMLSDWAKNDKISHIFTTGCNGPSDQHGSSEDWDKSIFIVTKDNTQVEINFEYTDYEDSGLDDISLTVRINGDDVEDLLDQNADTYGMDTISEKLEHLMVEFFGCSSTRERDIRPLRCFDTQGINQAFQLLNASLQNSKEPEDLDNTKDDGSEDNSEPSALDYLMMLKPKADRSAIEMVYVHSKPVSAVYFDEEADAQDIADCLNQVWDNLGRAKVDESGEKVYFSPDNYGYMVGFSPKSLIFYDASKSSPFGSINPVAAEVKITSGQRIVLPKV